MSNQDTSLDDIAQSVADLGTMISKEFVEVKTEQRTQGIILEDLKSIFDNNIDLLTKEMSVKKRVDGHEDGLANWKPAKKLSKWQSDCTLNK